MELDLFQPGFRRWVATQPAAKREKFHTMRDEVVVRRAQLESEQLAVTGGKLDELAAELTKGFGEMEKLTAELKQFPRTADTLGRVLGLVARVLTFRP